MAEVALDETVQQGGRDQKASRREGDAGELVVVAHEQAGAPHGQRIQRKERREQPPRVALHDDVQKPHAVVVGQRVEKATERAAERVGPGGVAQARAHGLGREEAPGGQADGGGQQPRAGRYSQGGERPAVAKAGDRGVRPRASVVCCLGAHRVPCSDSARGAVLLRKTRGQSRHVCCV